MILTWCERSVIVTWWRRHTKLICQGSHDSRNNLLQKTQEYVLTIDYSAIYPPSVFRSWFSRSYADYAVHFVPIYFFIHYTRLYFLTNFNMVDSFRAFLYNICAPWYTGRLMWKRVTVLSWVIIIHASVVQFPEFVYTHVCIYTTHLLLNKSDKESHTILYLAAHFFTWT